MRFLIDANLSPRLAEWLRTEGHEAVHVSDVGLAQAPDREIFAYAARELQVVVTSDLGFGEILAQSLGGVSAIIVRLRTAALATVVARLERTLVPIAPALRDGAVVIVEETRPRVRRLPLGRYETCRFCYPGGINPTWRVEHGHLRFGRP